MLHLTTVGSMNYNVLRNLLSQGGVIRLNRGAEIGVLYGDTSAYLLREFPELTLFSVDPYVVYSTDDINGMSQAKLDSFEATAREKLKLFGERSQFIKKYSKDAVHDVPDGSLDFVFIDANHTYDAVREDIALWEPKVRSGGLVTGHDYKSFPEVTRAVDEFAQTRNIQGFYTPIASDVWFFVKG